MFTLIAILLLSWTGSLFAQIQSQSHVERLRGLWDSAFKQDVYTKPIGDRVLHFAQSLKGTPYVAGTLDIDNVEQLIINAKELDCVTFVDNTLALAQLTDTLKCFEQAYGNILTALRYRDGYINGYASRLHYSTAWLLEMIKRNKLRNITPYSTSVVYCPKVDFMSRNYMKYPALLNDTIQRGNITAMEHDINNASLYFIPKEKVINNVYNSINDGDIILITTYIKGLDTSHLGIAVKRNNLVYLVHASSEKGEVVETLQPLKEYLMKIKNQSGIIIARPQ